MKASRGFLISVVAASAIIFGLQRMPIYNDLQIIYLAFSPSRGLHQFLDTASNGIIIDKQSALTAQKSNTGSHTSTKNASATTSSVASTTPLLGSAAAPASARQPRCRHFDNRIIYHPNTRKTGLNDRLSLLTSMSNLAAFLCAKLVVPSPSEWLDPKHNHDQLVSTHLTWNDNFARFHLIERPGESAVIQKDNINTNTNTNTTMTPTATIEQGTLWLRGGNLNYFPRLGQQFDQAYNWSLYQQDDPGMAPFIWDIVSNYYRFRNFLCDHWSNRTRSNHADLLWNGDSHSHDSYRGYQETLPTFECQNKPPHQTSYVVREDALEVQRIAQGILQKHTLSIASNGNTQHNFAYLHIRRGDSKRLCNTSPARMSHYLQCSLQNFAPELQQKNLTVLFSSDEPSMLYRKQVRQAVEHSLGMNRFVDLDETLKQQRPQGPDSLDNYRKFAIINFIAEQAAFRLKMHRFHCRECDLEIVQAFLEN